MTIEQYEIAVPLFFLALGGLGILYVRWLSHRLHRDDPKTPPAE